DAGTMTRTGYTFSGWNTAANGSGTAYAPAATFAMPDAAVTLFAQWTINSYTLTYDGNSSDGGVVPTDPSSPYDYGATVTVLDAGTMTRTGYTFNGWNTAFDGSGTAYAPAATFAMPDSAVTLFAQWVATPTYTVTYYGNGSDGGTAPVDPSSPYASGSTVTVMNQGSLSLTGYSFAGWNTAANGSGTAYAGGATFTINANTDLYAQWTVNSYALSYDGNSSDGGVVPTDPSSPYDYGSGVTVLDQGTLTLTGNSFVGWNTATDGSGTWYYAGFGFSMPAAALTLYAQWTAAATYTVTYDGNTNDGGTAPVDSNLYLGTATTAALTEGTLTKTGFSFLRWNTQADGLGTDYNPGDPLPLGGANVTLYAIWG
ncbi:MAG: InlB B-repeat-containing protein, partial [Spirochaetales bacterium]|nr:InlB B-repeat-containing protein [Spirochaetales bacterium]